VHSQNPSSSVYRLWAAALLALLFAIPALGADTLYLKSGVSISVTRTQEKDGEVQYWVGDDQYSISKSEVLKIEAGDAPVTPPASRSSSGGTPEVQDLTRREPGAVSHHDKLKVPLPTGPRQNDAYWTALRNRIMVRDAIDDQRLAEIEIQHENRTTADAFYLAAVTEMERGNAGKAAGYFEHAIRAMPDRVDLLKWHAVSLAVQGRYTDADSELERANSLEPNSPDILRFLGLVRYDADRTREAIAAWKQALELSPDPETRERLHKAERELEVEEGLKTKESRHFTLRYQGERLGPELQQQLMATLENSYQDLARQLSYEPLENIVVILYTQKEFSDITEAPSWAGALNDGKLRIPLGGVSAVEPQLERVLRHELTHSFLYWLAKGRCPTWLNEGVAQLMEPRTAAMYAPQLGPLFLDRKAIPFSVLERPFMHFSDLQAEVAYAESLAAVEYLRDRYGLGDVVRMLESIGSGVQPERALTNSTGMDYSVLQQRIGQHMAAGQ
jgi:tetratricopeptide (TPR) repeat protein